MRTSNWDIKVAGNSIGGRQGWAYVCNSGEITVLEANLDKPQEYETWHTYGQVSLAWNYRGRENYQVCTLGHSTDDGKNVWKLTNGGCFLSSSFGLQDAVKLIHNAQAPKVHKDEVVAIASYSSKSALLCLYKVTDIDINCMTSAVLEPLTEEEMDTVVANAINWLR